jgi:hypothetical protein
MTAVSEYRTEQLAAILERYEKSMADLEER